MSSSMQHSDSNSKWLKFFPVDTQVSPVNFFWFFYLPLAFTLIFLIFEPTPIDFWISDHLYSPIQGFIGKRNMIFEDILHDRAKQACQVIGFVILVCFIVSLFYKPWKLYRRRLLFMVIAILTTITTIIQLKNFTGIHCPFDLLQYGGKETYNHLFGLRALPVEERGRCWPGGHVVSAFAMFALYFGLRDIKPNWANPLLVFVMLLGTLFSVVRVMQGAHFISHNFYTMLISWLICFGLYYLMLYRPYRAYIGH